MDETKELKAIEKTIRGQLWPLLKKKDKSAADSQKIDSIRTSLRSKYVKLILAKPKFATEKELGINLWKICFYKHIEEYRILIRNATRLDNKKTIRRITGNFLNFLDRAKDFYKDICSKLDTKITQANISGNTNVVPAESDEMMYTDFLHRMYICLGDVCRYRENYSGESSKKKTYDDAAKWYEEALALIPGNGYPHNQLAVLTMYADKKCLAIYRYIRSVCTTTPFTTGEENLVVLYQRINLEAKDSGILTAPSNRVVPGMLLRSSERNALRKRFLLRFSYLHSELFADEDGDFEPQFTKNIDLIDQELPTLLRTSALSRELQIAMVVTCMHSVVRATNKGCRNQALAIAFKVCKNCVLQVRDDTPSRMALLVPVSVFVDWLQQDAELVREVAEESYFQDFLEAISSEWKVISDMAKKAPFVTLARQPLQEEVKLKGFLLLEKSYEPFLKTRYTETVPERSAHAIRASKVLRFCESLFNIIPHNKIPFPSTAKLNGLSMPMVQEVAATKTNRRTRTNVQTPAKLSTATSMETFDDFGEEHRELEAMDCMSPRSELMDTTQDSAGQNVDMDEEEEEEVIVLQPNFGVSKRSTSPRSSSFAVDVPAQPNHVTSFLSPTSNSISSPIDQLFNSANMLAFAPKSEPSTTTSKDTFSPFAFNAFSNPGATSTSQGFANAQQWNDVQLAFAQPPSTKASDQTSGEAEQQRPSVAPPPGFY